MHHLHSALRTNFGVSVFKAQQSLGHTATLSGSIRNIFIIKTIQQPGADDMGIHISSPVKWAVKIFHHNKQPFADLFADLPTSASRDDVSQLVS